VKRALRPLAGIVLAFVIVGALIARLRRIERPVTDLVARSADDRVHLLRVRLARRGEPGHTIGYSVRCRDRVVWNLLARERRIALDPERRPNEWRVLDERGRELAHGPCPE
jgi:hypothetical protein